MCEKGSGVALAGTHGPEEAPGSVHAEGPGLNTMHHAEPARLLGRGLVSLEPSCVGNVWALGWAVLRWHEQGSGPKAQAM